MADPYGVEVVWVLVVGCWTAFVVAQYFHGRTRDGGNGGGESRHGGMDFVFNNGASGWEDGSGSRVRCNEVDCEEVETVRADGIFLSMQLIKDGGSPTIIVLGNLLM